MSDETDGLPLFCLDVGRAMREEGMRSVLENEANLEAMVDCILHVAERKATFNADDVMARMEELGVVPHHPNAFGAAFVKTARLGFIESTERFVKSTRTTNRSRDIRIWKSTMRTHS